jgi:hypothetical protein
MSSRVLYIRMTKRQNAGTMVTAQHGTSWLSSLGVTWQRLHINCVVGYRRKTLAFRKTYRSLSIWRVVHGWFSSSTCPCEIAEVLDYKGASRKQNPKGGLQCYLHVKAIVFSDKCNCEGRIAQQATCAVLIIPTRHDVTIRIVHGYRSLFLSNVSWSWHVTIVIRISARALLIWAAYNDRNCLSVIK